MRVPMVFCLNGFYVGIRDCLPPGHGHLVGVFVETRKLAGRFLRRSITLPMVFLGSKKFDHHGLEMSCVI